MEVFYEDILDTFLFCFLASAGIIQIMVGRRGWHGLSIYGGRVRRNLNYAIGAALLIFAYAWYFSDPLHRNVRNIEAFMSLACLVLGIVAAAAATALLASLSDMLRRRLIRDEGGSRRGAGSALQSMALVGGTAFMSSTWGERGENLVVLAEPGKAGIDLSRRLYSILPQERGFISLHPDLHGDTQQPDPLQTVKRGALELLDLLRKERGIELEGETFLGLGWAGDELIRLRSILESTYSPRRLVAVAPVVPDCDLGFLGDAFLSNTPFDIGTSLAIQKPWKEARFTQLLRLWLPVLAICVVLATAVTVGFDVRWKFFSGPMAGLFLSVWVTYFLALRRGEVSGGSAESRLLAVLCGPDATHGSSPLAIVLTSGDRDSIATLPLETRTAFETARLELWEDVLRGKFLLSKGTLINLRTLIWEESAEGPEYITETE